MPYFSMNFKDLRRQGEISLETSGRHRSPHPEAHLDAGLNMMARQGWELREVVQQSDKGPIFIFYKAA